MSDIYSSKKRSEIMRRISGAETKPEILVRKALFAKGFRYLKNVKSMPGKPDIVLPKHRFVILIHGCFWHGHDKCKASALPASNTKFWSEKIGSNKERDAKILRCLRRDGWNVMVVWQCKINSKAKLAKTIDQIVRRIKLKTKFLIPKL